MSFEQEIFEQNNSRKLNILKSFSEVDEIFAKGQDSQTDGEGIEKGFDSSTQRTYADNPLNRKLNRVGQKYGGRNEDDPKGEQSKNTDEENPAEKKSPAGNQPEQNTDKSEVPQETQPKSEYDENQLTEFASSAEDWQLEEFIKDATASGDNSEYMQKQLGIAKQELESRRGGAVSEGNAEEQDANHQEEMSQVDENGLPDFNDKEAVKNFLAENPAIRERTMAIVEDDIFITVKDAIKLANAEMKSGGEALKHVEEAKQTLDELHAKLGGGENSTDDEDFVDDEDYNSFEDWSDEDLEEAYRKNFFHSEEERHAAEEELNNRGIGPGSDMPEDTYDDEGYDDYLGVLEEVSKMLRNSADPMKVAQYINRQSTPSEKVIQGMQDDDFDEDFTREVHYALQELEEGDEDSESNGELRRHRENKKSSQENSEKRPNRDPNSYSNSEISEWVDNFLDSSDNEKVELEDVLSNAPEFYDEKRLKQAWWDYYMNKEDDDEDSESNGELRRHRENKKKQELQELEDDDEDSESNGELRRHRENKKNGIK